MASFAMPFALVPGPRFGSSASTAKSTTKLALVEHHFFLIAAAEDVGKELQQDAATIELLTYLVDDFNMFLVKGASILGVIYGGAGFACFISNIANQQKQQGEELKKLANHQKQQGKDLKKLTEKVGSITGHQ